MTTCKLCSCICKRSFFSIKIDCDKLVRTVAPKRYLTPPLTELEAGTLATSELCLFVLLIRIAYLVVCLVSCVCFGRDSHFMRASSDLKGILRGSSFFTLGGVLKKTKKLIRFIDNWRSWRSLHLSISKIKIAVSSWFSFLGLRADVVVFYPPPDVYFQVIG